MREWLRNGWLIEHRASPREITDLLGVADRDLTDCRAPGLSPDWRLNIAYNGALQAAAAALAAAGYRAGREAQHYRLIQSLAHTIGADVGLITRLDIFRKKRNISEYERMGAVSDHEAEEMFALAKKLRDDVEKWLRASRPELL